jgi:branched-subunit amino acid ABC-type transport system permease component
MNVLNFAHGQMYVLGGFVTYTVVSHFGLPFIVGLLASGISLAAIGALVEKYLFRPVIRNSKREESTMLLAAGIAFFLDAVILLLFGEKQRGLPKIVDGVFNWDFIVVMPYDRILIGLLAIAMVGVFILFMQHSKTGRAMRALAQDKVAARLMGVDVDRYSMIGFSLGAMLAGITLRARQRDGAQEGAYFGWWNCATKLNLALAAGLALPALAALGYQPGAQAPQALRALTWAYCLLPCGLKLAAAVLLFFFHSRKTL